MHAYAGVRISIQSVLRSTALFLLFHGYRCAKISNINFLQDPFQEKEVYNDSLIDRAAMKIFATLLKKQLGQDLAGIAQMTLQSGDITIVLVILSTGSFVSCQTN